jgi:hypothetical protein
MKCRSSSILFPNRSAVSAIMARIMATRCSSEMPNSLSARLQEGSTTTFAVDGCSSNCTMRLACALCGGLNAQPKMHTFCASEFSDGVTGILEIIVRILYGTDGCYKLTVAIGKPRAYLGFAMDVSTWPTSNGNVRRRLYAFEHADEVTLPSCFEMGDELVSRLEIPGNYIFRGAKRSL